MRNFVKQILIQLEGEIELLEAEGGMQGIALFEQHSPDVMMLDLLMPDVSGHNVIQAIRKKGSPCFITVLTSNIQQFEQDKVKQLGADLFLGKPLNLVKAKTMVEAFHAKMKILSD